MSDPSIVIMSPRRRGRPSLSQSGGTTPVSVRVPDDIYDRACHAASVKRMSLPDFIRDAVDRASAVEFRTRK